MEAAARGVPALLAESVVSAADMVAAVEAVEMVTAALAVEAAEQARS